MSVSMPTAVTEPRAKTIVDAASYAIVHMGAALSVGMLIEQLVPPSEEDEEITDTLLRASAQVLANGIFVYAASKVLDSSQDPTGGILFTWGLIVSQPSLTVRLQALSSHVADAVSQLAPSWLSGGSEAEAPSR